MTPRRQLLAWVAAAVAALIFLVTILVWQRRNVAEQWSTFLVGDPHAGFRTFEEKGCSGCHGVFGGGAKVGPDLGLQRSAGAGINQLVTQMWNHAPRMWAKIEETKTGYPTFSTEEMANLFAFLYATCYTDESGNAGRGRFLFTKKGCNRCHSIGGEAGKIGPDLKNLGAVDTPLFWAQEMWNHATSMEAHMRESGMAWPRFEGKEMNDLLAYIREERSGPQREFDLLPADPGHGWSLFKKKGCITCHAIRGRGGTTGPDLARSRVLPSTVTEVAGQMWNHSPEMMAAMKSKGLERPKFAGQEMADLIAFLFSLRSFELAGSPHVGRDLFNERNCSRCHGTEGKGGEHGPGLREAGRIYTPVTLAQALWLHGPRMYKKSQELGFGWPRLQEGDLDHLLAFLNTVPEKTN